MTKKQLHAVRLLIVAAETMASHLTSDAERCKFCAEPIDDHALYCPVLELEKAVTGVRNELAL